jgi:GT2 family glycosyltransferase
MNNQPIDIFILCFRRVQYTKKTLDYLFARTTSPIRIFLLIQGYDHDTNAFADSYGKKIFLKVNFSQNIGPEAAWNTALALAESKYFITSDNDIYVPELRGTHKDQPDWLVRLIKFIDEHPNYGAISLHPHVFIGINGEDPNDPEDVKEAPMAGAVMRIMRRDAVQKVGGWDHIIRPNRGAEERDISAKLRNAGYKVGRTTRIRAYHPFGADIKNNSGWGYEGITPEQQGHTPALKDYVLQFDHPESYDSNTWLPK